MLYVCNRTDDACSRLYASKMLHEFLTANRKELIVTCIRKSALRRGSVANPSAVDSDVSLFLTQLVETLRKEQSDPSSAGGDPHARVGFTVLGKAEPMLGTETVDEGYP